jgi:hypothetical protein
MLLGSSIMLLENIYSTGIAYDNLHTFIIQATVIYKFTIVNDASRVISESLASDATIWSVTYHCHSDNSRGGLYTTRVKNLN